MQKRFIIRSDYFNGLWYSGYFLWGKLKCGTPPSLKQISVVVGRLEGVTWSLIPVLLLNFIVPNPDPWYSSETTNITICENLWRKKKGNLSGLFYFLPGWSPTEMFYISFISLFSAFPFAPVCISKVLAVEMKIKYTTTSLDCQNLVDWLVSPATCLSVFFPNWSCELPCCSGKCWCSHLQPSSHLHIQI